MQIISMEPCAAFVEKSNAEAKKVRLANVIDYDSWPREFGRKACEK